MNRLTFFFQFLKNPATIGSLVPSSNDLAQEISSEIGEGRGRERRLILEIGPGTGSLTERILSRMTAEDELHLVEIDSQLCKILQKKYQHQNNITIFNRSIAEHTTENGFKYDFIISGLPLNAFPYPLVEQIFLKFIELGHEKTRLSYFEYLWLPFLSLFFLQTKRKKNLKSILTMKKRFYEQHSLRTATIYRNFPPARVVHHTL